MESDFTTKEIISKEILLKAYTQMMLAKSMADIYEENRNICKYVHSTSRGHEAIQLATAYQLSKEDWVSPYYRDESLLLGIGAAQAAQYKFTVPIVTNIDSYNYQSLLVFKNIAESYSAQFLAKSKGKNSSK